MRAILRTLVLLPSGAAWPHFMWRPFCGWTALVLVAILLVTTASSGAFGATYYWDFDGDPLVGTPPASTAGSGTWNAANTNWNLSGTAATDAAWVGGSDAVFAGSDGTHAITVGSSLSVGNLTFSNSGYTLSATSSSSLSNSVGNNTLTVAAGATATLGNNVNFTNSFNNALVSLVGTATAGGAAGTLVIENGGRVSTTFGTNSVIYVGTITNSGSVKATTVQVNAGGSIASAASVVANGLLKVEGGSVSSAGGGIIAIGNFAVTGMPASAILTINSGTVTSSGGLRFGPSSGGGATAGGVLNLNGGTLVAGKISSASSTNSSTVNFNGGTWKATTINSVDFLPVAINNAVVKAGGAVIDTAGFDVVAAKGLSHDAGLGATADGGLTKSGSGTLTLSGTNTYTGSTRVSAGTLALGTTGSLATSGTVIVGTAGSSGAVLDLTAKTGTFEFGPGQTVGGIGTINIGAGKAVSLAGIWAPGNSIGSNAVTGNITLSGTSLYELGTPGSSTSSPGTSDFTAVSGTLALGGSLTLLDNANANSQGSYGAGAYRLFTYGAVSGSYAGITSANATTRGAIVYGGSGTAAGQGVYVNVYNLAVGTVASGTSVNLGLIHAGSSFTSQSLAIGNAATAGSFSEGLNATVSGSTGNATWGGAAVTNLTAGGTSSTITASLGDTSVGGVKTGSVTIGYQSNGTVSGLSTVSAGSQVVSLTGSVFSGTATWNVAGGGAWGSGSSGDWTSVGGIGAAPGTFAGYTNTDGAIFAGTHGGTSTIQLNGAAPSLASLVFSSTTGRYVIEQGSGGSLTLASGSGKPTISVAAGAVHEIKTAISGTSGLEKLGGGKLLLTGQNDFSGGTDISLGVLAVNGSLAGAVNVASAAVLGGSGTITGPVSVFGTLSPGNSPGVITLGSLVLGGTSTTFVEINGLVRGTDYDGITITGSSGLTYGGLLSLSFGALSPNDTTYDIFAFSGGSLGGYTTVQSTGAYSGTWTSIGDGTFQLIQDSQTLTFSQATGDIIVVPEPSTMIFAGLGVAMASWSFRRRRRIGRGGQR